MRHTPALRALMLAAALSLPATLRADETPSVKEGFKEVGRAITNDSKAGWEATKDVSKKGWDKTKEGVGVGLEKTGEGVGKAADGMKEAGEDVKE
ncbi:MAG: hypothetical protein ABI629_26730 [bacterium]